MSVTDRPRAEPSGISRPDAATENPENPDVAAAARRLVAGLVSEPWGQVSPSVYETGRLVTLAPWLTGHDRRVEFLVATQRPDGGWGAPGGYALVPTLSATEALLTTLRTRGRDEIPDVDHAELAGAADRGLRALFRWLHGDVEPVIPDMPAVELIAPSLIALVNRHLDGLRETPVPALGSWRDVAELRPPAGMNGAALGVIRSRLSSGAAVPQKLLHALEAVGDAATGLPTVHPESTGTIGASPAATAAWLGHREPPAPGDPARTYLEAVAARHGGPVPCGVPVTVFERAWVLGWLKRVGIEPAAPAELVRSLSATLGPTGTPAAAGLPADADTTAAALYALSLLGAPHAPDPLSAYELETHFCTWQGEDGESVSTNAHVLEAYGQFLDTAPGDSARSRHVATVDKVASWLRGRQEANGSWLDRWHASPYYATACCALALDRFGGVVSAEAVRRAVRWVLATQNADGSWGHWAGTAEETAYSVHVLLLTCPEPDEARVRAAARGRDHLLRSLVRPEEEATDAPSLWHDKDLYRPTAIVRSAVLAALHLTQTRPFISAH